MERFFVALLSALFLLTGCQQINQFNIPTWINDEIKSADLAEDAMQPEEPIGIVREEEFQPIKPAGAFPLSIETTLVLREKFGGNWKHTYHNEVLDYSGLVIEMISFSPDSNVDSLSLKITLPENWSQDINSFMQTEGLRLSFDIDGKQVDAFRQRGITLLEEAHTYMLTYQKCILDSYDLNGKTLTIRPYVTCYQWIESKEVENGVFRRYNLAVGESYTGIYIGADQFSSESCIINLRSDRTYLDACAISHPLAGDDSTRLSTRPTYINAVTINDENWGKSILDGVYKDGSQIPPSGTVFLRDKDFSDIGFALEEFHIWQDEMKLSFVWRFPESWTNTECRSMVRHSLNFLAYTGDKIPENPYNDSSIPFVSRLNYFGSIHQIGTNPNWENDQTETFRELYFQNWYSILTLEQWKAETTLTIVPWYWRYTECDGEPIPENGFPYQDLFERTLERVYLSDLAITLDITPDLFEAGF